MIHLAGIPGEASWPRILDLTSTAATDVRSGPSGRDAPGDLRLVEPRGWLHPAFGLPGADYAFPAPDTYYGVSKATVEALAAMYHHRYGMDAICLRILSCFPRPKNVRMLSTWLSPDDAGGSSRPA